MVVEDMTEVQEKCTKQLAQSVKKNAKSLSSQAATVRYIAGNVFQNAKAKAVKNKQPEFQSFI